MSIDTCPNCHSKTVESFFDINQIPVHNTLLLDSKKEAVEFPKGDISLGFCSSCAFIFNTKFDPSVHQYSEKYEETQGFSPTFQVFHKALAQSLLDKHSLHKRKVLEIGCGKGEFLSLLCELGECEGVGIDPAYVDERNISSARDRMTFIQDFYSEKYGDERADFICCKMTLEHIQDTKNFLSIVRNSILEGESPTVFFQVPNMSYVLHEAAFWDIYYEHCSYFTQDALIHLFENCGFIVQDVWTDYNDQYLMIEAIPGKSSDTQQDKSSVSKVFSKVQDFLDKDRVLVQKWQKRFVEIKEHGQKAVIWGGGSKGVAFLTRLGIVDEVEYVVDVNPYKDGKYMAGTGQKIVSPEFLKDYCPDIVVIMNPVYRKEITEQLHSMQLFPEIIDL